MKYLRVLKNITRSLSTSVARCEGNTMKILNVAEKNDAAKNISGLLSHGTARRRDGFSVYNKIYEFDYTIMGQRSHMIMTSVSGHLLGLEFMANYRNWRSCNPLALFDAPVTKSCIEDFEPIKRTLEREVRQCGMLIIWTDCDREGENIGFEIIQVCSAVKPNIDIYRAKFSEITAQSIQRAIQNLARPDKRISDAVDVRQELDLRIGAAFTRFQTLRLQRIFPETLSDSLISYGSCQFPTLGFVVERYKAIENFVPETFWKIKVTHTIGELTVDFNWKRVRLFDEQACQVFYDICMEQPIALVEKVQSKPKSKWRPLPLDTVELEKLASRKLKINAKETMRIAEKLYSQGFISYPRTETNIFPKEMDLRGLINMQSNDPHWGEFANRVLQDGPNPRAGKKSDQAHPPIHPTKYTANLNGNEQRVYEFIVRHFLACCSKDAEGMETVIEIDINSEKFVATGLMIVARNYLEVYPYETWNAKEIHKYEQGQRFKPTSIEIVDGSTSAPNLLTEADLIALMEKHGIGTDATHAEHIETIKSRLYVGLENGIHFVPGQLGMGLVEGYDKMGFSMSKPNLRAELESDLKKICEGLKNPEAVLREQLEKYKNLFTISLEQAAKIDEALAHYLNEQARQTADNEVEQMDIPCTVMKCKLCGTDMVLKTKRDGSSKYVSCMGFPQCKNAIWFPGTIEEVKVSNVTCPECGPTVKMLEFKFRHGSMRPYYADDHTGCIAGCDTNLLELLGVTEQINRNSGQNRSIETGYNSTGNNSRPSGNNDAPHYNSPRNTTRSQRDNGYNTFNSSSSNQSRNVTNFGNPLSSQRTPSTARQNNSVNQDNFNFRNFSGSLDVSDNQQNKIVCSCDHDAILLTVKKEGPNTGRKFYKCGGPQGQSCNFFMWADDSGINDNRVLSSHNVTQQHQQPVRWQGVNSTTVDSDDINCNCNIPAKRLTVQKEGPNKGRQFYSCSKPQNERCNFFKWAEDIDENSLTNDDFSGWGGGGGHRGGSRGGGRGMRGGYANTSRAQGGNSYGGNRGGMLSSTHDDVKKKRKCAICHQEGHNKKTCPNRGQDF